MENNTPDSRQMPVCPVCENTLTFRIAKGRKSNKPFIMLICPVDGRHIRGFIGDQGYIQQVIAKLESRTQTEEIA